MYSPLFPSIVLLAATLVIVTASPHSPPKPCPHTACQRALEEHQRFPHSFCYDSHLRVDCNTHQECDHCRSIADQLQNLCNQEVCPHPAPPKAVTVTKPPLTVTKTTAVTITKSASTITKPQTITIAKPMVTVTITKATVTITKPAITLTKAAVTVTKPEVTITEAGSVVTEGPVTITKPAVSITKAADMLTIPAITITETKDPVTVTKAAVTITEPATTITQERSTLTISEAPLTLTVTERPSAADAVTVTILGPPGQCMTASQSVTMTSSSETSQVSETLSITAPSLSNFPESPSVSAQIPTPSVSISAPSTSTLIDTSILDTMTSTPSLMASVDSSTSSFPINTPSLTIPMDISSLLTSLNTPTASIPADTPSIVDPVNTLQASSTQVASPPSETAAMSSTSILLSTSTPVSAASPTIILPSPITTTTAGAAATTSKPAAMTTSNLAGAMTTSMAAAATTLLPPASTTTSLSCIPSPTQAIVNPSFEDDLENTGTYTYPWFFSGNGNVQSNVNNAYQSFDGTHFAVLYGRSTTTVSMRQTINNLVVGTPYTLQYYYNVEVASPQAICKLTVSTTDVGVLDTLTSPTVRTGEYRTRSVGYTPTSASSTLVFTLTCPRFVQLTAQSNFALDAITLTSSRDDGCRKEKRDAMVLDGVRKRRNLAVRQYGR